MQHSNGKGPNSSAGFAIRFLILHQLERMFCDISEISLVENGSTLTTLVLELKSFVPKFGLYCRMVKMFCLGIMCGRRTGKTFWVQAG